MSHVGRRQFLIASGALLAAPLALAPFSAIAQQVGRVYRIGFLLLGSPSSQTQRLLRDAFWLEMRERGWVEGKNIAAEYRWAENKVERFPELAAEILRLKPDLILTFSNSGVTAARNVTQSIPIVSLGVNDPVKMGFAQSLARPGGNVTGLTFEAGPTLDTKAFELLKEAAPSAKRIAMLLGPGFRPYLDVIPPVAKALGVELLLVEVGKTDEIEGAFARMKEDRAEALFVPGAPLFVGNFSQIAQLALKQRLPVGGPSPYFADGGGLIGFGIDIAGNYRRAADFVDKILKGATAGNLPFEQPMRFELAVNLKTAKALGLTVPQSIMLRADRVIE